MPPLINSAAVIQCAHGGVIPLVPSGIRPLIGGAPGLCAVDLVGKPAVGCVWNVLGVPTPCAVVAVAAGICARVSYGGVPALHQGVVCMTSNGLPTQPCSSPGQVIVQGI